MNKPINKIKLNKGLWFTILGNKIIFGNSSIVNNLHYTFSFGNKSSIFDLHLTNKFGEHFTVLTISHQEFAKIFPQLLFKIQDSVMDLKTLDEDQHLMTNSKIYKIEEIGDIVDDFPLLTKKKRLIIDKDSQEFEIFVSKIKEKYAFDEISLTGIKELSQFHGIVISENDAYFILKNPYLGDNIFKFTNFDLDFNSVFEKIIGEQLYNEILDKINEGIRYLKENENTSC